jgi:polyferredoxin
VATATPTPAAAKKKLVRRVAPDHSQTLRRTLQILFFALNIWIGVQFFLFVRYFENGGQGLHVSRPPGVEGWLPIASLMNLKVLVLTGSVPQVHPAGLFLLLAFAGISLLLRKAFCSWLCPVGTLSEYLWKLGRRMFRRNFSLPRWADIPVRGLKYILLGLFLYAVLSMPVPAIQEFLGGPYGIISDVKMLNFFRFLSVTGTVVLGILLISSILIQNFWCRYLCPYGALMGFLSMLSPTKIRRETDLCIDCGKCAKACPSLLPVDKLITINSAECTGCLECVAVCPAEGALALALPSKRPIPAWLMTAGIACLFLGIVGYARLAGYWHTEIPEQTYLELIPHANKFGHP